MNDTILIPTSSGHELAVCEWGSSHGEPVFVLHGSPGSRYIRHPAGEYDRVGIRAVTYDRPGYGRSTRRPGRLIAATADDVTAIADAFGFERFAVFGVSGGGPHALAVAALLPERVTRCATAVSIGPADQDDLDFFDGMTDVDRQANRRAMADTTAYITEVGYPEMLQAVETIAHDHEISEQVRQMMRAGFSEALAPGPGGMIDDYAMSFAPWGFDVASIRCPVTIMAAEQDVVSQYHGTWLKRHIPNATYVLVPGGHVGPRDAEEEELLAWLVSDAHSAEPPVPKTESPDSTTTRFGIVSGRPTAVD